MDTEELKFKEQKLRKCFMEKLEHLNVEGENDYMTVKCIKTYGALWHYVHQLCMAEGIDEGGSDGDIKRGVTVAETMDIQATGLKMRSK